jgi:hypothetical protein
MTAPRPVNTAPRDARIWIRGICQLPAGRQITRTVRRDFILLPGDSQDGLTAETPHSSRVMQQAESPVDAPRAGDDNAYDNGSSRTHSASSSASRSGWPISRNTDGCPFSQNSRFASLPPRPGNRRMVGTPTR